MLYVTLLSCLATLAALVSADAAPETQDSPKEAFFQATFRNMLRGSLHWDVSQEQTVNGYVDVTNLPFYRGPFKYQIADGLLPDDQDCLKLKGTTFNPYNGEFDAPTDAEKPVGDLSGKYKEIPEGAESTHTRYLASFISLNPDNKAYIGDKSVFIEDALGTILECANIIQLR